MAELVGVVPGYLVKLRQGHRGARSGAAGAAVTADSEKERIARRFFAAMVLNDLIQEVRAMGPRCTWARTWLIDAWHD